MIVRTSRAGENSFTLLEAEMRENDGESWQLYTMLRSDLRFALKNKRTRVAYSLTHWPELLHGWLVQGVTQRRKKFISIGCMKFVGENRKKLIKWAKGGK
jgi:hypothetical protein